MTPTREILESEKVLPIPFIDVGNLLNLSETEFDLKNPKLVEIAKNIRRALHEHGFLYLSNHGIPQDVVSNAFEESRLFFNQPAEIKMKSAKTAEDISLNFNGYSPSGEENHDTSATGEEVVQEWKEVFDFFEIADRKFPTEDLPNFEPTIVKIENMCRHLETKLLKLLAVAVGIEDTDYFYNRCKNLEHPEEFTSGSGFRSLFYSPIPEDLKKSGKWIGCNEHTDWGVLTLLFQDNVGGLEVRTREGEWVKAIPVPNTIVCNTGALLEHWTGGYFPAVPHRVHVRPFIKTEAMGTNEKIQNGRQSMVFFLQPDDEVTVEPLESNILPKNHNLKPISAREYYQKQARLAYGQEM